MKTRHPGFSIIEVTMVIALMAVLLAFALPNFSVLIDNEMGVEVKKIARIIRKVRLESMLSGCPFKLVLDKEKHTYQVMLSEEDNEECQASLEYLEKKKIPLEVKLPKTIKFYEITRGQDGEEYEYQDGDSFSDDIEIFIDPSGFVDLFEIALHDKKEIVSLKNTSIIAKLEVGDSQPYKNDKL